MTEEQAELVERIDELLDGSGARMLAPRTVFDQAIVGIAERADGMMVVAYDSRKCIEAIMEANGVEYLDAVEDFEHNTAGAWYGDGSPVFVDRLVI